MSLSATRPPLWIAALALLCWAGAVAGFGASHAGYSHAQHPVGLLGAYEVPGAMAFNMLGFVVPGLLVAGFALALRGRMPGAGWPARLGMQLVMLSGLAFAGQGLVPLDATDFDASASRLHATVWSLWWIAFLPGAVLLALRSRPFALALAIAAAAVLIALAAVPVGLSQRLAVVAWFALVIVAGLAPAATAAARPGARGVAPRAQP